MTIVRYKATKDTQIRDNTIYGDELYMVTNNILNSNFNVIGHELLKEHSIKPKVLYLDEIQVHFKLIEDSVQ